MELFYIDRQFGQAIFIDVEKGIVQKVYNDKKMEKKMNELYKGKSISFLKEDFEKRMKPSYHSVRCAATIAIMKNIQAIESRINNINPLISVHDISKEKKELLIKKREELTVEKHELYEKFIGERVRVLNEHNFIF